MNKKVIKIAIIISWVLLGVCIIFKLCGSNVFELAIKNQGFIDLCNWLQGDGRYLFYVIGFLISTISNTFILLASSLTPKPNWKQLLLIEGVNIPVWFIKFFFPQAGFIVECVMFIVIPAVISKKWWTGFLGLALNVIFQVMSMFIKGHGITQLMTSNIVLALVFLIDYYIMIALYYLYVVMIKKSKQEVA